MRSWIPVMGMFAVAACASEAMPLEDIDIASEPALRDVASGLNGQMLLAPCLNDVAVSTCTTHNGACPSQTGDLALRGALLTDKTIVLGGTQGKSYTIKLHIQGEVEAKQYVGGTEQDTTQASPTADGFHTGGTPTTSDFYAVNMIRVTNPGSTTHTDYFLNSLVQPGVSNHTTYGVDYTASITAKGGATIRLVSSDANCSETKNCGPTPNNGTLCNSPIVLSNIEPAAKSANPNFNFTTPYNGEWLVMVVKSVSSP